MSEPTDGRDLHRFTAYTRWSVLLIFPAATGAAALSFAPQARSGGVLVTATLIGLAIHLVASCAYAWRALAEASRPHRFDAAYLGLSLLVLAVFVAACDPALIYRDGIGAFAGIPLVIGATVVALGLTTSRPVLAAYACVGTLCAVAGFGLRGVGITTLIVAAVLWGCIAAVLGSLGPLTWWTLDVVRTLDRSRATHARLAVAEERLRFSRDLHDVYGRALSAIALKSELAAELARRGDDRAAAEMTAVREIAQESLTDARRLVSGYREIDAETELAGARSVLRSAGARVIDHGLPEALAGLTPQARTALAWVVREASTNALRHSDARRVEITAARERGDVVLTVVNDGVRGNGRVTRGAGLVGLGERVAEVGGRLDAACEGGSFVLTAAVPDVTTEGVAR